jgi:peptidoglycan/xylan/chitin deacetylase (PgdA/CDA1 family)
MKPPAKSLLWILPIALMVWPIVSEGFLNRNDTQDGSAVVLIYHRFGEERYSSTNVRREQFENQIKILAEGGYHFPDPLEFAARIARGRAPSDLSILVTVDDAFRSALEVAWPVLKSQDIPLTLFVATDPVDAGQPGYLSWDEIRGLERQGVVIGHHGGAHGHLTEMSIREALKDIRRASRRFETELGHVPKLFAYPYGEYSPELERAIRRRGFIASFAQYSGAISKGSPAFSLPRFAINEHFGDSDRFRLVTRSRALPVRDVSPPGPQITSSSNPPRLRFRVASNIEGLEALACYPSHMDRAAAINISRGLRVQVQFEKPFPPGRNRINCTLPSPDGRWYWFGRLFMVPGRDSDDIR